MLKVLGILCLSLAWGFIILFAWSLCRAAAKGDKFFGGEE